MQAKLHQAVGKKIQKIGIGLFGTVIGLVLTASPTLVKADPQSDFGQKERQLSAKAAEVQSLSDEVKVLDDTIEAKVKYLADIHIKVVKARQELSAINQKLSDLQKKRLVYERLRDRYVKVDYVDGTPNEYELLVKDGSLMTGLASHAYLGFYQSYADQITSKLQDLAKEVEEHQAEVLSRYRAVDGLEAEAAKETAQLAAVRTIKERLLVQTQGQEAAFRKQYEQARHALESTGAFARSARDRIGSRVWDDSGFYFNQLDSRWINAHLGFSNSSTIGDYGCGLTSLAMVFKNYGITTNPPQLNEELKRVRAFVDDLLDWRNVAEASGGRLVLANDPYPTGRSRVNWGFIDQQLEAGNPVIVYIDRGSTSHYVTLLSKRDNTYLMHDPIEGPYLLFSGYYDTANVYQFITFRRR